MVVVRVCSGGYITFVVWPEHLSFRFPQPHYYILSFLCFSFVGRYRKLLLPLNSMAGAALDQAIQSHRVPETVRHAPKASPPRPLCRHQRQ